MKKIVQAIDTISEWAGRIAQVLSVVLVVLVTFQVVMRYVFTAPQLWAFDLALIFGAVLYSFALGYTQLYKGHVAVELIYARLPSRVRGLISVLGHLFVFFPMMSLITYVAVEETISALQAGERFDASGWYPPAAPLYGAIALGLIILILQNIAQLIRDLHLLIKREPYD